MGLVNFSLSDIGSLFTSLREAVTGKKIEDPVEAAKVGLQLDSLEQALKQGQIEINKEEAKSSSVFVAGWRPYIGWICGAGLGYQFILYPLLGWLSLNFGYKAPPILDISQLMALLGSMLGLAGYRTVEKMKGVQGNH